MSQQHVTDRKEALDRAVTFAVATGGSLESRTDYQAVLAYGKPPNHVVHAVVTLLTWGLWAIVWIIVAASYKQKRVRLAVDPNGKVWATYYPGDNTPRPYGVPQIH